MITPKSGALLAKLDLLLNSKRLAYAWIAGGAMWLGWLISIALGSGQLDLAHQVIGGDYLQFYAAGTTLRTGQSALLYDIPFQIELEQSITGPELESYHAFITPPFLAWLFVPFSALPYGLSFAAWSVLGLSFLWFSLRSLGGGVSLKGILFALSWYPVFAAISFGQNSLLSLAILCLVYLLWRKERLWLAGLTASLLMYKPQLAIGLALLWLLEWRRDWRALAGLALGSGTLAGLCFWLLPDASLAYLEFARTVLPDLPSWKDFPIYHLHTVRGFWRLLLPGLPTLADLLWLLASALGLWAFWRFWQRNRRRPELLFAAATCLTLWLTPHAMTYDWALLLIPALLLWRCAPSMQAEWKVLYALLWIAMFLSTPLTVGQLRVLPFAVQISVPALAFVLYAGPAKLIHGSTAPPISEI